MNATEREKLVASIIDDHFLFMRLSDTVIGLRRQGELNERGYQLSMKLESFRGNWSEQMFDRKDTTSLFRIRDLQQAVIESAQALIAMHNNAEVS